jgi:hypothetical protein
MNAFPRRTTIVSALTLIFYLASVIAVAQQNESAAGDMPVAAPVAPADWRHYNANAEFQDLLRDTVITFLSSTFRYR